MTTVDAPASAAEQMRQEKDSNFVLAGVPWPGTDTTTIRLRAMTALWWRRRTRPARNG
jgi:hypothetical protein